MKIGIVCYPTFGGSGVVATELGKALAGKGHEVHFITYQRPVRLPEGAEHLHYHEVVVKEYPLFQHQPYELILSNKIVEVAKKEGLDLIHVHYAIPHASAAYMAKQILASEGMDLPIITTLHGTDITLVGKDETFEPVISFAINQSDVVTSVSQSLKEDTLKYFTTNREIEVVPNFICLDEYQESDDCKKEEYAPQGEKVLMHVSNFRKVKRVEDVVKVFCKVRESMPAKLLMIGEGPEKEGIEKMCKELDCCDDIYLLGEVANPEQLLCIADVFLLPSETESFGLAALEAMAAKVPVISTNTGGLPEVNEQGVSGFLSNVGDIEDMTKNALNILSDEEKLKSFKQSAYQRAKDFDIQKILPQYEALYQRLYQES